MSRVHKRTQAQRDFDLAKHGWAFCNAQMLRSKVNDLLTLSLALDSNDERHASLTVIEQELWKMEQKA